MTANRLQTINLPGNLHEAARLINSARPEIVDNIVAMDTSGHNTVVVYRWPVDAFRANNWAQQPGEAP